jgi:hypothetical protein
MAAALTGGLRACSTDKEYGCHGRLDTLRQWAKSRGRSLDTSSSVGSKYEFVSSSITRARALEGPPGETLIHRRTRLLSRENGEQTQECESGGGLALLLAGDAPALLVELVAAAAQRSGAELMHAVRCCVEVVYVAVVTQAVVAHGRLAAGTLTATSRTSRPLSLPTDAGEEPTPAASSLRLVVALSAAHASDTAPADVAGSESSQASAEAEQQAALERAYGEGLKALAAGDRAVHTRVVQSCTPLLRRAVIIQVSGAKVLTAISLMRVGTNRNRVGDALTRARISPRPPNRSTTTVARTQGYTYAAEVWALCVVQGPFSVAPCPNPHRPTPRRHSWAAMLPCRTWQPRLPPAATASRSPQRRRASHSSPRRYTCRRQQRRRVC